MEFYLLIVVIAFLVLIAVELLLIYRELVHIQTIPKLEEKETRNLSGQTINVNLANPALLGGSASPGTPLMQPAGTESPGTIKEMSRGESSESMEQNNPQNLSGSAARRESPRGSVKPVQAKTIANPFAKVCAACGAENSTYRTECFNCGKPL
jgi:hypothetical protein